MVNYLLGFSILRTFLMINCVSGLFNFSTSKFSDSFDPLYGFDHVIPQDESKSVQISLDDKTSSGFRSKIYYDQAYFSASIKLPSNYTAGVVVTFYLSNNQAFQSNHDEIDFEFLGNTKSANWVLQTNMYGNGSTPRGREERYHLWFDPTESFHNYSVLWSEKLIIYFVDDVPVREVPKVVAMAGDYPSKPMALYGTIWDGSSWATDGLKVDYRYSPFIARYSNFVLHGCTVNQIGNIPNCGGIEDYIINFPGLTFHERNQMRYVRAKYMFYSYCNDHHRYPVPLPECATA